MSKELSISIVIPTYNGAHKVIRALESLLVQTRMPDEVIVVIDGSTDHTREILESNNFQLPKLRLIEQPNGGRAKVRNAGAALATSDLLLFMDDDIIAPASLVAAHLKHHLTFPNSLLTGKLDDPNKGKGNDFLDFKAWLNERWNASLNSDTNVDRTIKLHEPYISANNFSVCKCVFNELGGFDERLTDAEDYDLAVRANNNGYLLYVNNDAFAWHNDQTNCARYIQRLREYQRAQEKLIALKPELYLNQHRYAIQQPLGLKKMAFQFFGLNCWVNLIDQQYLFWLPKNIRYRIFDYVITAKGVYEF